MCLLSKSGVIWCIYLRFPSSMLPTKKQKHVETEPHPLRKPNSLLRITSASSRLKLVKLVVWRLLMLGMSISKPGTFPLKTHQKCSATLKRGSIVFQFIIHGQQSGRRKSENPMNTTNLELLLWIDDVIHNNLGRQCHITSPSSLAGATSWRCSCGYVPFVGAFSRCDENN